MIAQMEARLHRAHRVCLVLYAALLLAVLCAFSAHAAEDGYTYPNYDPSVSGCVDLMDYVQRITVTINGVDYTKEQLKALKDAGTPLTQKVGDKIAINFLFALQGRAYAADDSTRLDPNTSTKVVYTAGTTSLNGDTVAPGQSGILDDSSLMVQNTTPQNSYLRMDIAWIYDVCPGDYTISFTDGTISFVQGTGENSHYLYVYFPGGIGQDQYANPGYFTINLTETKTIDKFHIPGTDGYYLPGTDGWDFYVVVTDYQSENSGTISTYGDITIKKIWITDEPAPTATIKMDYTESNTAKTAVRQITGNGSAVFTIRTTMSNCSLREDMTGLDDYTSVLARSEDGKTYTFTNTKSKTVLFSKRAAGSDEELPGAKLTLYSISSDGAEAQIDSWTSGDAPHEIKLLPGNFRLHEDLSPKGYAVSGDITFSLCEDYTLKLTGSAGGLSGDTVLINDQPLLVKLAKTDAAGTPLAGASLTLTDATSNTLVDSWVSDGQPHTIQYAGASGVVLVAGHTYTFAETAAPGGYALAEAITFVFNGDGTIPGGGYHTLTMKDLPLATPTPTLATPTPGGQAASPGPTVSPGGKSPMVGVATGDSPLLWVWLGLGLLCLVGGGAVLLYYGRHHRR